METVTPPGPVELLWEYADAVADRRDEQQAWLKERFDLLSGQDANQLNLYERDVHAQQEHEYHEGFAMLRETIKDEEAAMELLDRVETGEDISDDEILAFIPEEFIEEEKRKAEEEEAERERAAKAAEGAGFFLSRPYGRVFRSYGRPNMVRTSRSDTAAGRLTTGRNQTRVKMGSQGVSSFLAAGSFFDATTDTHGGKVRRSGKKSDSYAGRSGRRVRKK